MFSNIILKCWKCTSQVIGSIKYNVRKTNLRWLVHVERMNHQRLLRRLLYSQLCEGKRNQGRPRFRFKDTVKRNLKKLDINREVPCSGRLRTDLHGGIWSDPNEAVIVNYDGYDRPLWCYIMFSKIIKKLQRLLMQCPSQWQSQILVCCTIRSNKGACCQVLDWIMKETTKDNQTGIRWTLTTQLEDLNFADDICLTTSARTYLKNKTLKLSNTARRHENRNKKDKIEDNWWVPARTQQIKSKGRK